MQKSCLIILEQDILVSSYNKNNNFAGSRVSHWTRVVSWDNKARKKNEDVCLLYLEREKKKKQKRFLTHIYRIIGHHDMIRVIGQ